MRISVLFYFSRWIVLMKFGRLEVGSSNSGYSIYAFKSFSLPEHPFLWGKWRSEMMNDNPSLSLEMRRDQHKC